MPRKKGTKPKPINTNLEKFRQKTIHEIIRHSDYIKSKISHFVANFRFFIIGSVVNRKKFTESSDIDLGIVIYDKIEKDLEYKIIEEIQKDNYDFGVFDVSLFVNEKDIKGDKVELGI